MPRQRQGCLTCDLAARHTDHVYPFHTKNNVRTTPPPNLQGWRWGVHACAGAGVAAWALLLRPPRGQRGQCPSTSHPPSPVNGSGGVGWATHRYVCLRMSKGLHGSACKVCQSLLCGLTTHSSSALPNTSNEGHRLLWVSTKCPLVDPAQSLVPSLDNAPPTSPPSTVGPPPHPGL